MPLHSESLIVTAASISCSYHANNMLAKHTKRVMKIFSLLFFLSLLSKPYLMYSSRQPIFFRLRLSFLESLPPLCVFPLLRFPSFIVFPIHRSPLSPLLFFSSDFHRCSVYCCCQSRILGLYLFRSETLVVSDSEALFPFPVSILVVSLWIEVPSLTAFS